MKNFILFIVLLFPLSVYTQDTEIQNYINQGIELHDSGNYKEALKTYKKGLKLDKESSLLLYEIGFTYYTMGNHKKAIKYFDRAIVLHDEHEFASLLSKGNSLDILNKPDEAIESYLAAKKLKPEDYSLNYNLALCLYKMRNIDDAEDYLITGLQNNPSHSSSHYLLGVVKMEQERRIESILSFSLFLFLESETERSVFANKYLKAQLNGNVERSDSNNIQIIFNPLDDSEEDDFSQADLMLSIFQAGLMNSDTILNETMKYTMLMQALVDNLESSRENKSGIWWDLYIDYLASMHNAGHTETFCHIINYYVDENSEKWLMDNPEKVDAFVLWSSIE